MRRMGNACSRANAPSAAGRIMLPSSWISSHRTAAGAKREDMTRPDQIVGPGLFAREDADRGRAIGSRDARRNASTGIDRNRERRPLRLLAPRDHRGQLKRIAPAARKRDAQDAAGVAQEEGDRLGRDLLGGEDKVALVLAVRVVDDDYGAPAGDRFDGALDGCVRHAVSLPQRLGIVQYTRRKGYQERSRVRRRAATRTTSGSGFQWPDPTHAMPHARPVTSSVHTRKLSRVLGPNVVVMATSAASRPRAINTRPIRGTLFRGSNMYHWPPRYASNHPAKSIAQ